MCRYGAQYVFPCEEANYFSLSDLKDTGLKGKTHCFFLRASEVPASFWNFRLLICRWSLPKGRLPEYQRTKSLINFSLLFASYTVFLCNANCRTAHLHRRKTDIWIELRERQTTARGPKTPLFCFILLWSHPCNIYPWYDAGIQLEGPAAGRAKQQTPTKRQNKQQEWKHTLSPSNHLL